MRLHWFGGVRLAVDVAHLSVFWRWKRWLLGCFFLSPPLLFGAEPGQEPTRGSVKATLPPVDCVLIDSDSNLDDLRALAVVVPFLPVRGVVVTDGILLAKDGAETTKLFLSNLPAKPPIPVMEGAARAITSAAPPAWPWFADARADALRIKPFLERVSPRPVKSGANVQQAFSDQVASAVQGCSTIGLLVIGPWSSFGAYQQQIISRVKYVVAQGRSPLDPTPARDLGWGRVNCNFDRDACLFSLGKLQSIPVHWVDLPDKGPIYPITRDFIQKLKNTPLGLVLKRLMSEDPAWRIQQQWDEMAAMFILQPEEFEADGQHYLPARVPEVMRNLESSLISGSR